MALVDRSQKWWQLGSIQLIGGIISIPFITSGLNASFFDIILANFFLFVCGICIVSLAFQKRLNAVENVRKIIGPFGMAVLAILILTTIVSWMAIHLTEGNAYLQHFPYFSDYYNIVLLAGAFASVLMVFGIRALKIMGLFGTPILLLLLVFLLFGVSPTSNPCSFSGGTNVSLAGLSIITTISLTGVIDLPTFFRHGKTKKDTFFALIVIMVSSILLQSVCVFFRYNFINNADYISNIMASPFYSILFIAFVFISMIASASWNIYAASVGLKFFFPEKASNAYCAIIGLVATILFSATNIEPVLMNLVTIGEIPISALIGIIVVEFFRRFFLPEQLAKGVILRNNIVWLVSAVSGFIAYFYWNQTEAIVVGISLSTGILLGTLNLVIHKLRAIPLETSR